MDKTIDLDVIASQEASRFQPGALNSNNPGSGEAVALLLRNCMTAAIKEALVLASESARTKSVHQHYAAGGEMEVVDKQSILDIEKLIK